MVKCSKGKVTPLTHIKYGLTMRTFNKCIKFRLVITLKVHRQAVVFLIVTIISLSSYDLFFLTYHWSLHLLREQDS